MPRPMVAASGSIAGAGQARQRHRSGGRGATDEHHGHEEQAAADEHRGQELILAASDPVADGGQEPQEGDAGEGDHLQPDEPALLAVLDPCGQSGERRIRRLPTQEQEQRGGEQDGEDDAGDAGRAQRSGADERTTAEDAAVGR